ncbi:7221_t:CDS:10 [Cetraspora pellucida]|uniref:7221_t:CDS:1 n=1 Tax=Cetraspora pellucida TaxID=1433469 RepID=A0A9N9DF69_9GLOM|nr:7221_t:CDS:10 [Cetraspora pellucida]
MAFFKKPSKYWAFDAIAVHYYDNDVSRIFDRIKKDLEQRAKMEDCDAQKAKELLDSDWKAHTLRTVEIVLINNIKLFLHKKLVTAVKTHVAVHQIRSEATVSTFADGAESMTKVCKAILGDVDAIVSGSVTVSKDYEKNGEVSMSDSAPVYNNETGFSDYEEKDTNLVRKWSNDGEATPTKRTKLNDDLSINSDFTLGSIESTNYDIGLWNYEEGTEVDPDLSFQETDEYLTIPMSERLFNEDTWGQWRLSSGNIITDLLTKSAKKNGHPLRPEVWGIVRCGFKIAKPGWCSTDDYSEIQRFTRRATILSCPHIISKLLKFKSLESLGKSIEEIRFLNNFNEIIKEDARKLILEELKTTDIMFPLQDPSEKFFIKIFQADIFPDNSIIQQPNVSESDYGGYMIHPFLKCTLFGLEKNLHYHIGEIILSSVKSCRERRRCNTLFEQKADGVFLVRLKKTFIEVGHLEMSGGYGYKDFSRSTWDGCCKLPIGNAYMLEEVGERFRGASCETFSKISNRIELWRMYVPSCGILQYERTHRAIVTICFEEDRKRIFDFVVVLWDLRCWLLEVSELIYKLLEEHNDSDVNVSNLSSGILPPHPFNPQKDKHKKGIITTYAKSEPGSSFIRSDK